MVAKFAADFDQFRFYDDDNDEANSTPLENEGVNHTLNVDAGNTAIQLRVRLQETGGADGSSMDDWQLDYSKNGGTPPTALTTTDSGDGIRAVAAGLTNDAATTNRGTNGITDGSGSFVAGEQSSDGLIDDHALTASDFTEHVWGIEFVAANVSNNDTFTFSIDGPASDPTNSVSPTITIQKTSTGWAALLSTERNRLVYGA